MRLRLHFGLKKTGFIEKFSPFLNRGEALGKVDKIIIAGVGGGGGTRILFFYLYAEVMGFGAAEATGLGFVFFFYCHCYQPSCVVSQLS